MKKSLIIILLFPLLAFGQNPIFEWEAGSNLDQVSGTAGTNTAVTYSIGEKGLQGEFPSIAANPRIQFAGISALNVGTGAISFVFWFKPDNTGTWRTLLAKQTFTELQIRIDDDDKVAFWSNAANSKSTSTVNLDQWNFLIITKASGGTLNMYLNSPSVDATATNNMNLNNAYDVIVGNRSGLAHDFVGEYAKAVVYGEVLTQPQINTLYSDFVNAHSQGTKISDFVYPKPTDLSAETGIVAGYNMIPSPGGVLTDISGSGNNGTIVGPTQTYKSLKFDGVNDYINIDTLSEITDLQNYTILARFKSYNTSAQGTVYEHSKNTNDRSGMAVVNNYLRVGHYNGVDWEAKAIVYPMGEWVNVIFYHTQNDNYLYMNGEESTHTFTPGLTGSTGFRIGTTTTGTAPLSGEIEEIRLYNDSIPFADAIAWNNSYATQLNYYNTFLFEAVGVKPFGWTNGTGTYTVQEHTAADATLGINVGDKYAKCTSPGQAYFQSEQAYGTWEFDVYKASDASSLWVILTSNDKSPLTIGGYDLRISSSEAVQLASTASLYLFESAVSYVNINTLYRFKVTRTHAGVFTVYIKGGSFGSDWTLVSAEGSGTNPVTNASYTTSEYSGINAFANDQVSNFKYTKGIVQ
jgi:hypothetical protein